MDIADIRGLLSFAIFSGTMFAIVEFIIIIVRDLQSKCFWTSPQRIKCAVFF